jgi:hypothetical protein
LRGLTYIIGQLTGALSGIGVCALWNFAMWGPTSILSLSGTSFSGAFVMSILAIVAVIASVRGHNILLLLIFFASFFPIGYFFLIESHWLSWTGVLNLGYLLGAVLMWQTRKPAVTDQQ